MGRPGLSLDRKFKRLARALDDVQAGFGEMLARGALELLWDSAYEACDDYVGDVDDVEAQAHWRGKRGTLVAALLVAGGEGRCGFIEEGGSQWWADGKPGTYKVHDLWDHAPEYAGKRAAREAEREARGTSLSEIRSVAGKRGRKTQLERKEANGGQTPPLAEQTAGNGQTNGGQTDAACSGDAGKTRANGGTPTPAPTPAPTPGSSKQPAAAVKESPLTQALLDDLATRGWILTHPAPDRRRVLEQALGVSGTPAAALAFILADLQQRVDRQQEVPGSIGFYVGDVSTLAKRVAAPPEPAAEPLPVLDLAWLDQLPEPKRTEAHAAWEAKQAELEALHIAASAAPRWLAAGADLLRQQFTEAAT